MEITAKPASKFGVGLQGDHPGKHSASCLAQNTSSKKPGRCQSSTFHLRAVMSSRAPSPLPRTMLGKHRQVINLCLGKGQEAGSSGKERGFPSSGIPAKSPSAHQPQNSPLGVQHGAPESKHHWPCNLRGNSAVTSAASHAPCLLCRCPQSQISLPTEQPPLQALETWSWGSQRPDWEVGQLGSSPSSRLTPSTHPSASLGLSLPFWNLEGRAAQLLGCFQF